MSTSIVNASADRNEQTLGTAHHFHLQFRELLTACIERDVRFGDRLLGEAPCDQFGVNHETVRDAWRSLQGDGNTGRQATIVQRPAPACKNRHLTGLSCDRTRCMVDTKALAAEPRWHSI